MGIRDIIFKNSLSVLVFGEKSKLLQKIFYKASEFLLNENIKFTNTPNHADVLFVCGPISNKLTPYLRETYDKMNSPKWVIILNEHGINNQFSSYCVAHDLSKIIPSDFKINIDDESDLKAFYHTFIKLKEKISQ
ncbi:MAG: NADH-quinone oxidoreductase subunit 6 [Alphaproteobacteria bacterium ADurb.Bin438]|nr:MAG: NADH-quinone oxidoreductase subunit 6 [Alphaproteobacteria bacterium ADurb.Bin438]